MRLGTGILSYRPVDRTDEAFQQENVGATLGGQYWIRTSDLLGVNEALYQTEPYALAGGQRTATPLRS